MKKLEKIAVITFLIGFIMKIFRLPGSSLLVVLSLLTLGILYYMSFALLNEIKLKEIFKKEAYSDTSVKRIIGTILLGFSFSITLMGILFKVQFYPGAEVNLLTGLITLFIALIIILIFYRKNKWKSQFYNKIIKRTIIIFVIGTTLFLTPFNTLIDLYYWTNPEKGEYIKEQNRIQNEIDAYNTKN